LTFDPTLSPSRTTLNQAATAAPHKNEEGRLTEPPFLLDEAIAAYGLTFVLAVTVLLVTVL
jgi:hypothetical protein